MRRYRNFRDVLMDELRDDPEQAYAYLQVVLGEFNHDGDTEHLMLTVRNVAEVRGDVSELTFSLGI